MENQQEVYLIVGQREFNAKKDLLIEYSDYFRAMFSGNFIEKEKEKIRIDVVDEEYMEIILRYMELGFIDLSDYQLSTVKELFAAANFLQITELTKQIDYCLEEMLSPDNWMEIREIAQSAPSPKLEQVAVTYGVHQFQYMNPEYFSTLQELFFYLSHPNLHATSELDVYTFGVKWCEHRRQKEADTLMVILCCLDYNQITTEELEAMKDCKMMVDMDLMESYFTCSDAKTVIECLYELSKISKLSVSGIQENRTLVCKLNDSEAHYNRVFDLVHGSIERKLGLIPAVPMWCTEHTGPDAKAELSQHHMFTYNSDFRLEPLIRIGESNCWGWVVTNWTPTKIVMCCGEYGRGTGKFERDVRVYDVLKKEWIQHGVQLPVRRHAGTVVVKDSLFILGGVGSYRKVLASGVVYDLKERTFRTIGMELRDPMQSPALCAHEDNVYVVGHNSIYKYVKIVDGWKKIMDTDMTPNHMVSFSGYIYVAQSYFPSIFRFRPEVDPILELCSNKCFPPMALCNLGRKLIAFTCNTITGTESALLAVEELYANGEEHSNRIRAQSSTKYGFATGPCSVVLDTPVTRPRASEIHKKILMKYAPPT